MKYLVSESSARSIREIVKHYLDGDKFAPPSEALSGYPVHSVYVDTPNLHLYRQTMCGLRNRFKLRVRTYDSTGPAFLEVKRRENKAIIKYRARLQRPAAEEVIQGYWPGRDSLIDTANDGDFANLQYFCQLRDETNGEPAIVVSYEREAFESKSGGARVTFDTNIRGSLVSDSSPLYFSSESWHPRVNGVVLELKFTNRVPQWMTDLVRQFRLRSTSVPKYCLCVDAMRAAGVLAGSQPSRSVG